MTEQITQTRIEDAIADTSDFLERERGAALDGGYASQHVAERVARVGQSAEEILAARPLASRPGFYVPLDRSNVNMFGEVAASLPGYMVLVPSILAGGQESAFYPAVVSEDGLAASAIRLHVLKQPYRRQLEYGAATILSGAGQSETKGVGQHGGLGGDGVEAEHFATLLAAGSDRQVQAAWMRGEHVNHSWRTKPQDSVISEVSNRLFGEDMAQSTITITRQEVEAGKAALLWHEGLRSETSGRPETATRENALVIIQALGHEALARRTPSGIDDVKRMLSV